MQVEGSINMKVNKQWTLVVCQTAVEYPELKPPPILSLQCHMQHADPSGRGAGMFRGGCRGGFERVSVSQCRPACTLCVRKVFKHCLTLLSWDVSFLRGEVGVLRDP